MIVNRKFVIKAALYGLSAIGIVILQINVFGSLKVFGAKPNLIMSFVIASSIIDGEKYGAIVGLVCGFAADAGFASPFLMSGLYYFFIAYTLGIMAKIYFKKSLITMMIAILIAGVGRAVINVFYINAIWDRFIITEVALRYILPEYLYTAVCAPALYFFVKYTVGKYSYSAGYLE